jgi:hypothetical protein
MKTISNTLAALTLLSFASVPLISCTAAPEAEVPASTASITSATVPGVPGGVSTAVITVSARVTAIDYKQRSVTLVDEHGEKKSLLVGPEAINFDQVKVGDMVNVAYAEELVVYLREKGEPSQDGAAGMMARAPKGNKPEGVIANTVEITAVVKSIDLKKHTATLKFPDGSMHTVAVRPDVDLTKAKIGAEVVIRTTSAIAISVQKP